jgi:hypothetical protein
MTAHPSAWLPPSAFDLDMTRRVLKPILDTWSSQWLARDLLDRVGVDPDACAKFESCSM